MFDTLIRFGVLEEQTGATIWVGLIAALIAIWGIVSQRVIARRRATLDHLSSLEADDDVIAARNHFAKISTNPQALMALVNFVLGTAPRRSKNKEKYAKALVRAEKELNAVRTVLNVNEMIAVGLQMGILDLDFFKRYSRGQYIRDWDLSAPMIYALREKLDRDALYHEFEQVVRWLKDNKMPTRRRWLSLWI